jgi:hypothetical protein
MIGPVNGGAKQGQVQTIYLTQYTLSGGPSRLTLALGLGAGLTDQSQKMTAYQSAPSALTVMFEVTIEIKPLVRKRAMSLLVFRQRMSASLSTLRFPTLFTVQLVWVTPRSWSVKPRVARKGSFEARPRGSGCGPMVSAWILMRRADPPRRYKNARQGGARSS